MNNDSANRSFHPGTELEEALAQGAHLAPFARSVPACTAPDFLHQDVSRRCQKHTELVGFETAATGPVEFEVMMQFF